MVSTAYSTYSLSLSLSLSQSPTTSSYYSSSLQATTTTTTIRLSSAERETTSYCHIARRDWFEFFFFSFPPATLFMWTTEPLFSSTPWPFSHSFLFPLFHRLFSVLVLFTCPLPWRCIFIFGKQGEQKDFGRGNDEWGEKRKKELEEEEEEERTWRLERKCICICLLLLLIPSKQWPKGNRIGNGNAAWQWFRAWKWWDATSFCTRDIRRSPHLQRRRRRRRRHHSRPAFGYWKQKATSSSDRFAVL